MRNTTLIILALVAGCETETPQQLGQFGEEEPLTCVESSRSAVSTDTVDIGYADNLSSVNVAVAMADGGFAETVEWSDGTQASLNVFLADAATPELVQMESANGGGECPTLLEFSVQVTLTTSDGRMNDVFVAQASMTDEAVHVAHPITEPEGTLNVSDLAQPGVDVQPDEVRVTLRMGSDFSGQLRPQPIGGIDDDARPLGSWPVEQEQ